MMYEVAGKIYAECDKFEDAARCFFDAKIWHTAGEYYERAKKYTEAAEAYTNGGHCDIVIDLMQR